MTPLFDLMRAKSSPLRGGEALPGLPKLTEDVRLRMEAENLAAPLPPLRAGAARARESIEQGSHGHRRSGSGESFWQFRRFQEGDFRSDIDWRASARHEHLHVREREKEAPIRFRLWWDGAPSMEYRSRGELPAKRRRAAVLLLALARLLQRGGENVELLPGNAEPQPPARGGRGDRGGMSCFVLASDFLSRPQPIPPALARRAQGHLLHIIDPAEEQFPFRGRIEFTDVEGGAEPPLKGLAPGHAHRLLGNAEDCAAEYRRRFSAHGERIASEARRCGWSLLRHRTDADARDALLSLHRRLSLAAPRFGGRDAAP